MKTTLEAVQLLFPEATERRGKIWLYGMDVGRLFDGSIPLSFTRRRYGAGGPSPVTYTWVHAFIDGKWLDLGDPWPAVMPKAKSLREMIELRRTHPVRELPPVEDTPLALTALSPEPKGTP